MAHSYHKNFGHLVFRADAVTIIPEDIERLHAYLSVIARRLRIIRPIVGGTENHIHILGDFPMTVAVADLVRQMKTTTTHWLHTQRSYYRDFSWNQGYGYFSVSASIYPRVENYILHQQEHHAHMTTEEEYYRLIHKHTIPPTPN